jgi:hypothetical protein
MDTVYMYALMNAPTFMYWKFLYKTVQLYILFLQLQYCKKKKQIFFPLGLGFVPVFARIVTKMHCRYLGGIAPNKSVFLNLRAGNN